MKGYNSVMAMMFHKTTSFKRADEFDRAFWRRAGPAKRMEATWLMVGAWNKMQGGNGTIPRLRKTLRVIQRAPR